MHCTQTLPGDFRELLHVDLQKDKKTAARLTLGSAAVTLLMLIVGLLLVPVRSLFSMEDGIGVYFLRFAVLIAGMIAYLVLHEFTHAAAMKAFGAGRLRFGFTGMYAYAGSEGDYFDKTAYRVIALAPLVVWTLLLTLLLAVTPESWFWVVYFIQIINVSGAAGDVYVTVRFAPLPDSILIRDTGVSMTVYDRGEERRTEAV